MSTKILPSWDSSSFKANLSRPAFYFYLTVPIILIMLGSLSIWMALAGDNKFASRLYALAFGAAFLKASESAFRFRIKSKNWPSIAFGTLCMISAVGVAVGGGESDDSYFLAAAAGLGPLLVLWGLYAWRTVERDEHKET